MLSRSIVCLALALLLAREGGAAPARESVAWQWRRVDLGSVAALGSAALTALAVDVRSGRVALGHTQGVAIGRSQHGQGRAPATWRFSAAARLAPVTDLHFGPGGELWIASLNGLWRLSPSGELHDRSPAPGDAAHRVRRVRCEGRLVAAATDAGLYLSLDGESWRALDGDLPSGSVLALDFAAVTPGAGSARLWLVARGELWRSDILLEQGHPRFENRRLGRAPGLAPDATALDLVVSERDGALTIVYPRALVSFEGNDASGFEVLRPVLPPGAVAMRVLRAGETLWLATDRGLLEAEALGGPWRRSPVLPVSAAVLDLAASPTALWVVGDSALYRGALLQPSEVGSAEDDAPPPAAAPQESRLAAREPSIRAVQEAALRHVGLTTEPGRRLREGLGTRGWLPRLSVNGGYAEDRDRRDDYDQSFVSGDTRHLYDRELDRALGWHVSLVASWDLSILRYDPEAVDFSREERQVIALRDDVLDEVNQIYFERLGLLLVIETATGEEAERARLRASELAAGLDGWTGGWFGERLRAAERVDSEAAHPAR